MRPGVIVVLIPLLAPACAGRSETSVAGAGGPATAAPAGKAHLPSDSICSQGRVEEHQSEAASAGSRFAVTRVEEPCSDLEFSEGQGMVIDSWKYAKNGEIEATRKSFFRPGERR